MLRKALMAAGCHGDPDRGIDEKTLQKKRLPRRIVLARSIPNGLEIPNLKGLARSCELAGYEVTPILVYRKTEYAIAGQVRGYDRSWELAQEYRELATQLAYELAAWLGTVLVVVPYEPFVTNRLVRIALFTQLGLTAPAMDFFNANEKYELEGSPIPI